MLRRPIAAAAAARGLLLLTLSAGCADRAAAASPMEIGCSGCVVLQGGTVFDGTRGGRGSVVIAGSRVEQVVFGEAHVAAGEVVDVSGKTVLPGLVDLHVHSEAVAGPYDFYGGDPHVEDHLDAMLRAGVTSYLDLGSSTSTIFDTRARLEGGSLAGPRLFAVGPLLTAPGGHPCYDDDPTDDLCAFIGSPADVAPVFAALVPSRPDLVKVVIDSGVVEPLPTLAPPALAAIEHAAEAASLRVIAHVSAVQGIEEALAAGIRLLAHVPIEDRISPDLARRMAAAKVTVVPTASLADALYRIAHGAPPGLDDPHAGDDVPADVLAALRDPKEVASMQTPHYRALTEKWRANTIANVATCLAAGVPIAAGTDAGNPGVFHGGAMAREIALYVEAGMKPEDALAAGTRAAADLLGRADLGRLEEGATADVLVVDGDALADVGALARVARVYQGGALVDRASLALSHGGRRRGAEVCEEPVSPPAPSTAR